MGEWREARLGDVVELQRGFDLPSRERRPGRVPIVSSGGATGTHVEARVQAPGVVTGRYGTLGEVFFVDEPFWPLNTTLFVKDFKGNDPLFVSYLLRTVDLLAYSDKAAVPGINRNHLHEARVSIPPLQQQRRIAGILGTLDDKIDLNRRRSGALEATAQALFMFWFLDAESDPSDQVGSLADAVDLLREPVDPRREPDTVFQHFSLPAYDAGREAISEPGVQIRSSKLAVPRGSVLLSKLNPEIARVWLPDI